MIINGIEVEKKWMPLCRWHFQMYFLNENIWISMSVSLKFVAEGKTTNIPALVQIVAWHRPGNNPLSEPMMVTYWLIYVSHTLNELTTVETNIIILYKEMEEHSKDSFNIRWQPMPLIIHQEYIQLHSTTWITTILWKLQEQLSTFFPDKCHLLEHSLLMNVAARETGFINSCLRQMIFWQCCLI